MLFLAEKRREGDYSTGDILFTSDSNNVNARFTSDYSVRRSGFTLDVQSIPCSDRENFPQHGDFNPHDVYSSTTPYPEYTEGYGNYSGNNGGCDESAEEVVIAARQVFRVPLSLTLRMMANIQTMHVRTGTFLQTRIR